MAPLARDFVRVATSGSVDDGKSTLIGRMVLEAKQAFDDEIEALGGPGVLDLAQLTDGLREESEKGITIDVAYRSFATRRRRFLLADSPGHVELTRNAVTALSGADVALVLVDARHGVVEQTRRHALLASLIRVPHLVVCVNKMDLVGFSRDAYDSVRDSFEELSERLDLPDVAFVPVSALGGDNVSSRSAEMTWYEGAPLLAHLEEVHTSSDRNLVDLRASVERPLQLPGDRTREPGVVLQVLSGVLRDEEELVVLGGFESSSEPVPVTIRRLAAPAALRAPAKTLREARPPGIVVAALGGVASDQGGFWPPRGSMLCRPLNHPAPRSEIDAMVFWMGDQPLAEGMRLTMRHTTRWVGVRVSSVHYRLDISTLHRDPGACALGANDIGHVTLVADHPLWADDHARVRSTGCALLVDAASGATLGALTLRGPTSPPASLRGVT